MISYLNIRNLALLDSVSLELTREFIAITGETGAGKSVLVGALKILAGSRVEKAIVRDGSDSCDVEAALCIENTATIDAFLEQNGLPLCEEGQLILFRSVTAASGKASKISVNGQLTSLGVLQKLGVLWLEYNSPSAVLELYTPDQQLAILDRYARIDLAPYTAAYKRYKAAKAKLDEVLSTGQLSTDEISFMERQIEKIDNLQLSQEGIDALEKEYKRLQYIEQEIGVMNDICEALGNVYVLRQVMSRARVLSDNNPQAAELVERLESLIVEMTDQDESWKDLGQASEAMLDDRERIEARMQQWMELRRRFYTLEGVMAHREELADKLQMQQNMEMFVDQYERELSTAKKVVELEQLKLLKARRQAADQLIEQTLPLLKRLGLPKARLGATIEPLEPTPNGGCSYELVFNANPGQSLKPLAQIGSSGELARVMLSLKAVLIEADSKPVVVFDEVDANVGGEVASSVADLLKKLGSRFQVFCITHLPQVAAKANFHLLVQKALGKSSTSVTITAVTDQRKRLEEIARMLGDRNAATALEHAKVLLER